MWGVAGAVRESPLECRVLALSGFAPAGGALCGGRRLLGRWGRAFLPGGSGFLLLCGGQGFARGLPQEADDLRPYYVIVADKEAVFRALHRDQPRAGDQISRVLRVGVAHQRIACAVRDQGRRGDFLQRQVIQRLDLIAVILRADPPDAGRKCRRSEEHTSELQSPTNLVCRLLLEKKKTKKQPSTRAPETAAPTKRSYVVTPH